MSSSVALIAKKTLGETEMPWLWVLSPLWLPTSVFIMIAVLIVGLFAYADYLEFKDENDEEN